MPGIFRLLSRVSMLLLFLLLAACGGGAEEGTNKAPTRAVSGVVKDVDGQLLSSVTVSGYGKTATTDAAGKFYISGLVTPADRLVLKFNKEGYFKNTIGKRPTAGTMNMEVSLMPRTRIGSVDAQTGGTLTSGSSSFSFGQDGFQNQDGSAVSGQVDVYANVISPDQNNFSTSMPGGDFSGQNSAGDSGVLTSFGALNIEVEDEAGNLLDFKAAADICVAVPASMSNPPAEVPVWSMNAAGVWEEVGLAKKVDGEYCFKLNSPGTINCDVFNRYAIIEGRACGVGQGINNSVITIDNQIQVNTDSQGNFSALVPSSRQLEINYGLYKETVGPLDAGAITEVEYGLCNITSGTWGYCAENYPGAACDVLAGSTIPNGSGFDTSGFQKLPAGSCSGLGFTEVDPFNPPGNPEDMRFTMSDFGSSDNPVSCVIWWNING